MDLKLELSEDQIDESLNSEIGKILIVDDDPLVLMALDILIKQEGFITTTATSGKEAIEILKKELIALILCDQRLPIMSGTEVMQSAINLQPDAIRIIITGNSDEKTAIEAINKGHVSQFIIKPWDDHQLRQTIHSAVEQYKLVQQNKKLQKLLLEKHKALASAHANLRRELNLGAVIHETLLLGSVPKSLKGLSIDAATIPSEEIDGDFFDFYCPAPGIFDIVIGDVMGKGIPAAVVGTAVKTQLIRFATPISKAKIFNQFHMWKEDLLTPWEILSAVHLEITKKLIRLEYFVCLFYARLNMELRTFSFVDCGSAKPIHYERKKKRAKVLKGNNFPLGVVETDHFCHMETHFSEGDLFVFYSDGVTECRNCTNEMYGVKRLMTLLEANVDRSSQEILSLIKESVLQFAQKKHFDDDLTLIVVKVDEILNSPLEKLVKGEFSSDLSQLKAVRKFIEKVCYQTPGSSELLTGQMQLAVNEAFVNIVKHVYDNDGTGRIIIQASSDQEGIIIEISDQGPSFDPSKVLEPSFSGNKDGGFGWHIIQNIVDQISYVTKKGAHGWNHLRIYKKFTYGEEVMEITHKQKQETLIVTLESESLDAKDSPDFKQKVIDLITSAHFSRVIFDLDKLKFIDSSGLGSFLAIVRVLNASQGDLKLARMHKSVKTMFELVSMHKIFDIYETVEEALNSFEEEKPPKAKTLS